MSDATEFAYAQARLQAQHGVRPNDAAWSAMEATVALGQFVANARTTTLASHLEFFAPTVSAHDAEQALRSAWRRRVFEAARWVPQKWQAAVQWFATATELPVLVHLERGGQLPAWLYTDPLWRVALNTEPTPLSQNLSTLARLAFEQPIESASIAAPTSPATIDAWTREWRRRWPSEDAEMRGALEELIVQVRTHVALMRAAESSMQGRALRQDMRAQLVRRLHMQAQTAAAVFASLLLLALDLERLREGLVRRMLSG